MTLPEIKERLRKLSNKSKAKILRGFFKTGPGEYGEGDVFIGVQVPALRKLVKECDGVSLVDARARGWKTRCRHRRGVPSAAL